MKSWLASAAVALLVAGCSSTPQSSAPDHSWKSDYSKWGKDPVAENVWILKSSAVAQRDYQGATYYFRNDGEAQKFDSNPADYAKSAQEISSQPPMRPQLNPKLR